MTKTDDPAGGSKPTPSLAAKLPSIRNRILSQSQLEQVARELDLYPADRQSGAIADLIQRMRQDIDMRIAGDDVLRVGYLNRDPKIAQAVTARLASLFVAPGSLAASDAAPAERFSIKVAATLPEKPYNHVRSMASVYGSLIGLLVGLAIGVFREYRDLTLASEDEVRRTLGVPVLGVISLMGAEHGGRMRGRLRITRMVV
jgi:capsular polysaccharide biosynthesis protein